MANQFKILGALLAMGLIGFYLFGELFKFCQAELELAPDKAATLAIIALMLGPIFAVSAFRWEIINYILVAVVMSCNIYATSQSVIAPKERQTLSHADENLVSSLKTASGNYQTQIDNYQKQIDAYPDNYVKKRKEISQLRDSVISSQIHISEKIAEIKNKKRETAVKADFKAQIFLIRFMLELALISLALSIKNALAEPDKKLDTPAQVPASQDLTIQETVKALEYRQPEVSAEAKSLYHWIGWKGGTAEKVKILQSKAFGKAPELDKLLAELSEAGIVRNGDGKTYRIEEAA